MTVTLDWKKDFWLNLFAFYSSNTFLKNTFTENVILDMFILISSFHMSCFHCNMFCIDLESLIAWKLLDFKKEHSYKMCKKKEEKLIKKQYKLCCINPVHSSATSVLFCVSLYIYIHVLNIYIHIHTYIYIYII